MQISNRRTTLHLALLSALCGAATASPVAQRTSADGAMKQEAQPAERGLSEPEEADSGDGPAEMDVITVTGTRIRGGESPSPVITIGLERIREEGFSDLGQVIRSVPQNFNGGQNPGVASGGFSGGGFSNANVTGGSALNLRGLGPDATLTLLNGRRMAYGGFVQAVDIAAIPLEAVDRIEIVADGASAIYGSDAVGGVGNVILKRDFDGVAVGARHGVATDGGLGTQEYTATAGSYWADGGLIASIQAVSVDPVDAADRHYTFHLAPPTTAHPGSELHSGLVSGYQALGGSMELRLDALWNRREQVYFFHQGGVNRIAPDTTTSLVSPGLDIGLPRDWTLSVGATMARSDHNEYQTRTSAAGVTTTIVNDCLCNDSRTWEMAAEGPLARLPGGDMRLAVGVGRRSNGFVQRNRASGVVTVEGEESARFGYAEVEVPIAGTVAGTEAGRLALTAAVRGEEYDSFGRVTTPKVGLVYSPIAALTAKASWGRSFKAPTLLQMHQGQFSQYERAMYFGGSPDDADAMAIVVGGGNPSLEPERAETWSASLAFHPESVRGLELELAAFHIDYVDRVVQPIVNYAQALRNPNLTRFIDRQPSAEELERIVTATRFMNFSGVPYTPERVSAVIYGHYANVARQRIRGADLTGSHRFDLEGGGLTVRGSLAWLDSVQQGSSQTGYADLSGTLFNPPRISGRLGLAWDSGAASASVFANHAAGVTNPVDGTKGASFTTFDATLRYGSERANGPLAGVSLMLSAQNLFDRPPPLYAPISILYPPYDSTNYSAIGRFVSLSVAKHF